MEKERPDIQFVHDYTALPFPKALLGRIAAKVYANENIAPQKSLIAILCSDYKIRKLNARYRKKDKPTDVLSFSLDEPDCLGEIYISLQRCVVDARAFGMSYDEEIERVFVHGLIHLLGYDHGSKMEEKERAYRTLAT